MFNVGVFAYLDVRCSTFISSNHWLSVYCKKLLVLFSQNSIGNCLNSLALIIAKMILFEQIDANQDF